MTRTATLEDIDAISHIQQNLILDVNALSNPSYRAQIQKDGFLIKNHLLTETFDNDIIGRYIVSEHEGRVVGYLRVDNTPEMTDDDHAYWLIPSMKEAYHALPHACISRLAVRSDIRKHGVAKEMLQLAEKQARDKGVQYLFSFVVLAPVTNTVSLLFHENTGFERVAITLPRPLFGMEAYQSILYYKKLL